ncbi:bifunctional demethylmenaquinone methyltransferase/2-methoxy-6-polyprenyl-1,4-benzoquinol methylase UbiE [Afifella sp. IM 167]|uniref:bifunctional demethylmenaquinone methyltransferase/2-methoxy-6-polyprenyl-1,4-benzoquinol methylase UbiE n=1 Tax=Afifella sp. IM 167 TaxID=2033586 RepID=UPI001CCD59AF|nr:bifunctional demethylmenaquinone methyltransferase/2-methoxy-6-polyprenyl-1,4-benzoquinol methylase UbiE [Afifella sp. IM 167]MBZ8133702.1 bifunctional demethylmenaquinone methyltransferase/2-methoxy-6-polyprenyl-1,4-benzoquinol methylase UbiE [Afifella sp. IM 167]
MSEKTRFGYQEIAMEEKQGRVDGVFHSVAKRYDVMNDLMSGGLHRLWKNAMVSWLAPPHSGRPYKVLDVAGGTGDIAFRIADRSRGHAEVTVSDINASMLEVCRERAEKRRNANFNYVEANAEELPFEDQSFDAYTIAFGIRNVPRLDKALSEAFRVLKPGGRFLCLEFTPVSMPLVREAYEAYSFHVIPAIGRVVTGDRASYQYLVESIRVFPNKERFAGMIGDAGFERVSYRDYTAGIVALHSGWKL